MFNGKIIITNHAKERYRERKIDYKRKDNVCKDILNELRPLNVRRMITLEDGTIHVFTKFNNKFVVLKEENTYIIKTIVRLNNIKRRKVINTLEEKCK